MKNVKMVREFEGELYTFEGNGTLYKIAITDLGNEGLKLDGGRFLVTVLSPVRQAYSFDCNDGDYIAPSYVKEKFHELSDTDAKSISEFLNEYFEAASANVFLDRTFKRTDDLRE